MKWRYAYDGDGDAVGKNTAISFADARDRTIQSAKEDSDINVIVRRFGVTGQVRLPNVEPFYGDFSMVEDYQTAMNLMIQAQRSFDQLPSDMRRRFGNDPAQLIDFVQDSNNYEEAEKLGLLRPKEAPPEPQLVRVVADPPPAGEKPPEGP